MLFRCNILAIVGGGSHPKYPTNKVMLWDDHQQKCIGELTFKEPVNGVRLRRDKVIVILEKRIYIYNFSDLQLVDGIETYSNPSGICSVSYEQDLCVLACPDKEKGRVHVNIYKKDESTITNTLEAHNSALSCMTLNYPGTLLATASEKGTLIRLYNPQTGDLLQEVRRGSDKAELYCLAIDQKSKWLGCTSDKGTVHIFSIAKLGLAQEAEIIEEEKKDGKAPKNHKHVFKFMKGLSKYFDSEWSFAKFRVTDQRTFCTFDKDENLIVVSADGLYYKASIDPDHGGDCKKLEERQILEDEES